MNNVEKRKKYIWILYYCLYVIGIVLMHKYMVMNYGDDNVSKQLTEGYSLVDWVVFRYNNWSARFLQEGLGYFMIWHPFLWKIINICIMASTPLVLSKLIDADDFDKIVCIFIFMLYPILDMKSAGWICTTNTYLWPAYAGLIVCICLKKYFFDNKYTWVEYMIFYVALIVACNHELLAGALLIVMVMYILHGIRSNKHLYMIYCGIIIDLINIVIVLISPGNAQRKEVEMLNHFEGFEKFSVVDKLYLGIMRVFKILVVQMNPLFLILCILVAIMATGCLKETYKKVIGIIPVSCIMILKSMIPTYTIGDIMSVNYYNWKSYIPLIMSIIILVSLTCSMLWILNSEYNNTIWYCPIVLLYAGLATQVAMGFSPTIYASGNRTATFMYFMMMYCIVLLYKFVKCRWMQDDMKQYKFGCCCAVLGCMGYVANLYLLNKF